MRTPRVAGFRGCGDPCVYAHSLYQPARFISAVDDMARRVPAFNRGKLNVYPQVRTANQHENAGSARHCLSRGSKMMTPPMRSSKV